MASKLLGLSRSEVIRAWGMWCLRMNTYQIAVVLKQPEAAVYNSLNRYRNERRVARLERNTNGATDREGLEEAEEKQPV